MSSAPQSMINPKAVVITLMADLIFGVLILLAISGFDVSRIDSTGLLLTIVIEILLIQTQALLIPALRVWSEGRIILKGPSVVLSRSTKLREEAEHSLYGVWCYSGYHYPELKEYLRNEKRLMKKEVVVHRIINVELAGRGNVKDHCEDFADQISGGQYVVTSTDYHSREFIVVDRKKVIILYQDLSAKDVGGGIGPLDDPNLTASYADQFEELERSTHATRLNIDPANPRKSIEDWISSSLQKKARARLINKQ